MVAAGTLATLLVAALASLFMAWAIGAGSSGSTPFAPAVGANAISVMRAGLIVGVLGFLGAVLQGANVTEAVGNDLVVGVSITATAAIVGLITAAVLVAIGVFAGYPIATAFTVTGAVVGAGLALGRGAAWAKYQEIGLLWILVPFVGGGVAYGTARLLRDLDADRYTVPALGAVVGAIVANIGFVFLGPASESVSMAAAVAAGTGAPLLVRAGATAALGLLVALVLAYDMAGSEARGQQHFLLALGALVAFSAGGTQVGLAVGPLIPLIETGGSGVPVALLALGGAGLLVGSWTGAPRMIKALSQDYSSLGPRRSIAALIPSFAIAQTAVFFGIPVSFNEIIVSAIVGSGYAAGRSGVSRRKMVFTVAAWIASLVLAFAVSYGAFEAVAAIT